MLPEDAGGELSSDQYYGYKICSAIMKRHVDVDLAQLEIGPIVHSRSLTLVCRKLYVFTDHPLNTVATIIQFCMQMYFPLWFQIK